VVVSNRLPAQPTTTRERQVGGLVSALEPALRTHEGIWLGWSGQTRDGSPSLAVEEDAQPRPGTETGTGRGDGGTGESGLNRIAPPSPRGLILPPSDRPSKVRGKTISVYVFVTDRGMVVGDSTRLNPGSGDSKFDTRLKRQAAEWVFHPAQRDGRAIAGWFEYTITL
jgi:hypothetical protein